ncbi:hypothetical protein BRC81_07285 [Halobacteriales archaeon QS_1_68_20]|nr:MAG: hypothetical protein BRC81_07285 [Halobacteriales archaeon QS_1_68_20]
MPATACSVLGADDGRTLPGDVLDGVDTDVGRVLVVLVDGLGLRQWRRNRSAHPLLERVTERARITPLTSVFPSETAAAIPTFHAGRLPSEHGGIGWNVYEPTADVAVRALDGTVKGGTGDLSRADVFAADPLTRTCASEGSTVGTSSRSTRRRRGRRSTATTTRARTSLVARLPLVCSCDDHRHRNFPDDPLSSRPLPDRLTTTSSCAIGNR